MINHDGNSSTVMDSHVSMPTASKSSSGQFICEVSDDSTAESSNEEKLTLPGGSISDRLAALQRSGSENWKERLVGRPKIDFNKKLDLEIKPQTPVMRVKNKPAMERPHSLLERIMKLGEAQDQWRNRVEEKDTSQFTIAGKMGQMQYSPHESPVLNRKRYQPKPLKIRSKTTNIEQFSSCSSENLAFPIASCSPLSKSQPSLSASSSSLDLEKTELRRVTCVSVPKVDDECFTSFFSSFKSMTDRIIGDTIKIQDELFEFITSEAHELLNRKKSIQVKRKHAPSGNPLKILASRPDLKMDYEEIYRGVAEKEMERIKLEKLSKSSSFALSALAGLASTEDFKSVFLKKTASNECLPEHFKTLLQIKGRRYAQVRLVEPVGKSMNHGDCYILVIPSQIYCYYGEFSNVIERAKGAEVAGLLHSTKDCGFKGQNDIIYIDEQKEEHLEEKQAFFDALCMEASDIRVAGAPDEDELYEKAIVDTNAVYEVENDELIPYNEFCGSVPKIEMLKPDKVYVFDYGAEMYVWRGKLAPPDIRKTAIELGKNVWNGGYNYSECDINPLDASFDGPCIKFDKSRPVWCVFAKVSQHMEPVLFKEKFFDWPNIHPLIMQKKLQKEDTKIAGISELKPCDVKAILEMKCDEPNMMLEGSHVGRGVEYHDESERRHFRISTISCKVWHISEYSYKCLPPESWGHFHNCDTYVIRWHYMISNIGRTLKGDASRHSFVGRKRWAYFFWQGQNSSITEKGASALMTIELNEEKGPHIRVNSEKEPPCFLNLFNGQMVVYDGKRDDIEKVQNKWKLFLFHGNMKSEMSLVEVAFSVKSLRSRASFVVMNALSEVIFIWHGCKVPNNIKEYVTSSIESLVSKKPHEMSFSKNLNYIVEEMDEGIEPKKFWDALETEDRTLYFSLLKSDLNYDFTPRLFLFTSTSGSMSAKEIICPSFTKKHACPFPFLQRDLKSASQPALFLLDNNHEVFLWQGWLLNKDKESDNLATGSAKLRWDIDRRLALEITLQYCQEKNTEDPPKAYAIAAGSESLKFKNIFPEWKSWEELGVSVEMEPSRVIFVQELLSQLTRDRYSLSELQQESRPPGVDPLRLESYLTDTEFEEVLGVSKEDFYSLPSWKQYQMKREKELF